MKTLVFTAFLLAPQAFAATNESALDALRLQKAQVVKHCEEGYRLSLDSSGSAQCVELPIEYSRNYTPDCELGQIRSLDKDGSLICKQKKQVSFFQQFLPK